MMRAIVYNKYGGPEVLQLSTLPLPILEKNEVLVKVAAASVNSWDWDKLTGRPLLYRLMFGLFKPKNPILGCDIAGIIENIGSGVENFKVGDAVFGDISESWGGFAEYVSVAPKNLRLKPVEMTFHEAAAMPHTAELAFQALFTGGNIQKGDQVLLNGGGGGAGSFAVQFAKNAGAEVTVVDTISKKEAVLSWGADFFIDYHTQNFWQAEKQYDLIVDMVASETPKSYLAVLKKSGRYVVVGGKLSTLIQIALFGRLSAAGSSKTLAILIHQPNKNLELLKAWFLAGKFKVHIAQIYSFEQVPEALTDLHLAKKAGKLVVRITA